MHFGRRPPCFPLSPNLLRKQAGPGAAAEGMPDTNVGPYKSALRILARLPELQVIWIDRYHFHT